MLLEGSPRAPHRMERHRELSCQCHLGLPGTGLLGDAPGPIAQAWAAEISAVDGIRGFEQAFSCETIAALRDAAIPADFAGFIPPRCEPGLGGRSPSEALDAYLIAAQSSDVATPVETAHRPIAELEADVAAFIEAHNENPEPYRWVKSADEIGASVKRFCQMHSHPCHELGIRVTPGVGRRPKNQATPKPL